MLFHWVDWWTLSRYSAIWEIALLIARVLAKLCSSIPITLVLKNRTAGWWNCLELSPREGTSQPPDLCHSCLGFSTELLGSEIAGSWYYEISLPWAFFGLRSKSVCLPLKWSLPHHLEPSCDYSFASIFTGERWEKLNFITSWSLTPRRSLSCLRDKQSFKLPPQFSFAVVLTFQVSVYGANYMSPHTISLSLAKYRMNSTSRGLEVAWYLQLTVIRLGDSAPTPCIAQAHWRSQMCFRCFLRLIQYGLQEALPDLVQLWICKRLSSVASGFKSHNEMRARQLWQNLGEDKSWGFSGGKFVREEKLSYVDGRFRENILLSRISSYFQNLFWNCKFNKNFNALLTLLSYVFNVFWQVKLRDKGCREGVCPSGSCPEQWTLPPSLHNINTW